MKRKGRTWLIKRLRKRCGNYCSIRAPILELPGPAFYQYCILEIRHNHWVPVVINCIGKHSRCLCPVHFPLPQMAFTKACCFLRLPRSTTCNPDCTSCGAAGMLLPVAPFQKREGILKCVLKLSRSTAIPCCWPGFGRLRGAAIPNQQGRMQAADCANGRSQFISEKHSDLCCAAGW